MNSWVYDVDLPMGALAKRHLQLTTETISFNGRSIPVSEIWSVAMQVTRHYINGIPTRTSYLVRLSDGHIHDLKVDWAVVPMQKKVTKDLCEQAYRTLLDLLLDRAGPRIVNGLLNQPLPFKMGSFEFSPDGIDVSGLLSAKRAPWQSITDVTMEQGGYTVSYVNAQGVDTRFGSISLLTPNAIFLPQLIQGFCSRFVPR